MVGRKAKIYKIWLLSSTFLLWTEDPGNADFPLSHLSHKLHSHNLDLANLCILLSDLLTLSFQVISSNTPQLQQFFNLIRTFNPSLSLSLAPLKSLLPLTHLYSMAHY